MDGKGLKGPVVQDAIDRYGWNPDLSARGKYTLPEWPYVETTSWLQDANQYAYEFTRGSRLATKNQLELCEGPINSYWLATQAAIDYTQLALYAENTPAITEGVFRVADTLMWYVSIFMACELTQRYITMTLVEDVLPNVLAPWNIWLNLAKNQFNIISDIFVILADIHYQDYNSMSFWIGDIFYQMMVISPYDSDDEYYQGNDQQK